MPKETKFTPGEWEISKPRREENNIVVDILAYKTTCGECGHKAGQYLVARTYQNALPKEQQIPNARLIAKSPEMYALLVECNEYLGNPQNYIGSGSILHQKMQALIAQPAQETAGGRA